MKRVISLILAFTVVILCLASCSKIQAPDETGAQIDIYMGTKVVNLDPATAYTDENAVKILSLVFEGLMKIDQNGRLQKALAKSYETYTDKKTSDLVMRIKLNTTYWSDGSLVQANDIVYAWKRILDPDFSTEAASLLYYIQGARKAKMGEIGIDDIGLCSISKDIIEVRFEEGADTNEFLYNLASPALVPLRENKISQYKNTWSRSNTDLSTNGPFRVRKLSSNETETLLLERSKYYYRNWSLSTEVLDKYVYPYRLYIHYDDPLTPDVYSKTGAATISDGFDEKKIFYVGSLTNESLEYFKSGKLTTNKLASTFSLYLNTTISPFNNQVIREALSLAIDRNEIASAIGCGTSAATGLIPSMLFDTSKKTTFRKAAGNVLSTNSGLDEAKELLSSNGINPYAYKEFYILYRSDNVNDSYYSTQNGFQSKDKAVCEIIKKAWTELGFEVTLKACTAAEIEYAYTTGEYDVMAVDVQALSAYGFYMLTPFARPFSGKVSLTTVDGERKYVSGTHVTGYASDEYDALIEKAFLATDVKEKASYMHDAEALLLKDAPVIPVIFNGETYCVSSELSGLQTNFFGCKVFTKGVLKNYLKYLETVNW